ncbi:MAG: Nudix family hydrolase [Burkholderiaceae bacterium]
MSESRKPVEVAVGVLIRPDGSFLLASRPDGKPYAGYWEFPGGKLEAGESVAQALARELKEELGVAIGATHPWVTLIHDYPHALVRLHFHRVFDWSGELQSLEQQSFGYFSVGQMPDGPLLPATIPVMKWLALPPVYAISNARAMGTEAFIAALERALARGLRLVQLREPGWSDDQLAALLDRVLPLVHAVGARVLVNSSHGQSLWARADGVHLTSADLARARARPAVALVGASVHGRAELDRAAELACDFAVAGPLLATTSHPGAATLGWEGFASLVAAPGLPVYAIGGMSAEHLPLAMKSGAHGMAQLSGAWR